MHFQSLSKLCCSAWRQLYICACIHNYHREWFDYPILRQEKQNAENSCFGIFFCPKAKAGALRKAFKFVSVAKTQSCSNPDFTISAWASSRQITRLKKSNAINWKELWGINCNGSYLLPLSAPTQPLWQPVAQPLPLSSPPHHSFHCYPHDYCPHQYNLCCHHSHQHKHLLHYYLNHHYHTPPIIVEHVMYWMIK